MAEIPKQIGAAQVQTNGNGSGPDAQSVQPAQSGQAQKPYSLEGAIKSSSDVPGTPKLSLLQRLVGKNGNGAEAPTGNTFTKLFGKPKEAPKPVDPAKNNSLTGAGLGLPVPVDTQSIAKLLGPKPKVSLGLMASLEQKRTGTAKKVFHFALALAVLVYGFFYTQLNPEFTLFSSYLGPNRAAQFERSNAELQKVQTDLNLIRYRTARLWLDEINTNIDPFQRNTTIFNSGFSTGLQKQNAAAELQILGASIKSALKEVQKIFAQPLGVDMYSRTPIAPEQREEIFAAALTAELNRHLGALTGETQPNQEEMRIINNVIRLVDNKRFRSAIKNRNFDNISEGEFSKMLTEIRDEATDELSAIDKIKRKRVNWGSVIQDVHAVTRKADLYYGQGLFKTVGGFLFNSYSFDAKAGRVSVNGITKTADSKTFSFIAQLVDSIEKSPRFKDIDFRSFSKNREENGDYSSSINLDFTIQAESDARDDIPLVIP